MSSRLHLEILSQPDDTTCGPTCLHAIYQYYGDDISLPQVIREVRKLRNGGTLAVYLACHALRRGYQATIFTYNLHMFDPTWFAAEQKIDLAEKLRAQAAVKTQHRLQVATAGYLEFLELGGRLRYADLTTSLIRKYLKRSIPILTGLSSTYLYRMVREYGELGVDDDVRGFPAGHFVVLCGYDSTSRNVLVADPYHLNPVGEGQYYEIDIGRALGAILLGVLTHDANFLLIEPMKNRGKP